MKELPVLSRFRFWGFNPHKNRATLHNGNPGPADRFSLCACDHKKSIMEYQMIAIVLYFLTEGIKNISNNLSITTKIDREHPRMKEYAKTKGWWDGKKEFNFAAVYSYFNPSRSSSSGDRFCEGYKLLRKHKGELNLAINVIFC